MFLAMSRSIWIDHACLHFPSHCSLSRIFFCSWSTPDLESWISTVTFRQTNMPEVRVAALALSSRRNSVGFWIRHSFIPYEAWTHHHLRICAWSRFFCRLSCSKCFFTAMDACPRWSATFEDSRVSPVMNALRCLTWRGVTVDFTRGCHLLRFLLRYLLNWSQC